MCLYRGSLILGAKDKEVTGITIVVAPQGPLNVINMRYVNTMRIS